MENKVEHTTIRNNELFCSRCGGKYPLKMPIPVDKMASKIESFNELHADCEQTYVKPTVDLKDSIEERMEWWLKNGERGSSSEVMFQVFSGKMIGLVGFPHPYDPADLHRCYLLLETIPEWKMEMDKLRISRVWNNLVDNWSKLMALLEEQIRTDKANGLYELMQELIKKENKLKIEIEKLN